MAGARGSQGLLKGIALPDDVTIRTLRADDMEALCDVTLSGWEGATLGQLLVRRHACLADYDWRDKKWRQVKRFAEEFPRLCIVAEVQGRVVGYATWFADADGGVAEVGNNAVHPDSRGRGIGTALQREILGRLRAEGIEVVTVVTLTTSEPARAQYDRAGYREIARSITYSQEL